MYLANPDAKNAGSLVFLPTNSGCVVDSRTVRTIVKRPCSWRPFELVKVTVGGLSTYSTGPTFVPSLYVIEAVAKSNQLIASRS